MSSAPNEDPADLERLRRSLRFYEGPNTRPDLCNCTKCLPTPSRHLSDLHLANPNHSYWDYLAYCINCVSITGLWLEFGVFRGATTKWIADRARSILYGFDSFEGIPEDWVLGPNQVLPKGTYAMAGQPPQIDGDNVVLITGRFGVTLPVFLERHQESCAFVHIDCDIYSATKLVLDTLIRSERLVAGTIVLFDELYNYPNYREHEYGALREVAQDYGLVYEWIAHTDSISTQNGNGRQAALRVSASVGGRILKNGLRFSDVSTPPVRPT